MSRLPEQRSWDNFKKSIDSGKLKAVRIENVAGEGTPDVIFENRLGTVGWIENKVIKSWPARDDTPPMRSIFEPGQMPFLRNWVQWKGWAFVLLRVEQVHHLVICVMDLREATKEQIINLSIIGKDKIIKYLEELH